MGKIKSKTSKLMVKRDQKWKSLREEIFLTQLHLHQCKGSAPRTNSRYSNELNKNIENIGRFEAVRSKDRGICMNVSACSERIVQATQSLYLLTPKLLDQEEEEEEEYQEDEIGGRKQEQEYGEGVMQKRTLQYFPSSLSFVPPSCVQITSAGSRPASMTFASVNIGRHLSSLLPTDLHHIHENIIKFYTTSSSTSSTSTTPTIAINIATDTNTNTNTDAVSNSFKNSYAASVVHSPSINTLHNKFHIGLIEICRNQR
jgi:hypothetical protein